jgi:hypothetical protein
VIESFGYGHVPLDVSSSGFSSGSQFAKHVSAVSQGRMISYSTYSSVTKSVQSASCIITGAEEELNLQSSCLCGHESTLSQSESVQYHIRYFISHSFGGSLGHSTEPNDVQLPIVKH